MPEKEPAAGSRDQPAKKSSESVKASPRGQYEPSSMEIEVNQLMSATKAGDRDAFDSLVNKLRVRAFYIAHSLVGSREDAFDMAQEAFLKTYRARETFRDGEPFLPWFHRILRNTCFSFLRKHKRLKKQSLSGGSDEDEGDWDIEGEAPSPALGVENKELHGVFWEALQRLTARDREILSLRHFSEHSYKEIAELLEIPEGTVMSRLFHARRHMRDQLQPHLDGVLSDYDLQPDPDKLDGAANSSRGKKR